MDKFRVSGFGFRVRVLRLNHLADGQLPVLVGLRTRNPKLETRNSSPHDFAKYQQNDKDKEETDGYQNKAQAGIIRSFLEHDGRHMMNFFDALHVPFDCAARDTRSAVQRLSSLVARPVQTLTNRAFIFPPS